MTDKSRRSFAKTITWRITASTVTLLLVYAFTGKLTISIGVASTEVVVKMIAYYGHERIWDKLKWGKN